MYTCVYVCGICAVYMCVCSIAIHVVCDTYICMCIYIKVSICVLVYGIGDSLEWCGWVCLCVCVYLCMFTVES